MKVLFDTAILVAASVRAHPIHSRALPWLKRAQDAEITLHIPAHSIAECYGALTTLPVPPHIQPATAVRLIHHNVEAAAKIVPLTASEYVSVVDDLTEALHLCD